MSPEGGGALSGRRVLVVGGSSGIGRATAQRCAQLGAELVVAGRRAEQLDLVLAKLGGGTAVVADVGEPDQCDRLVSTAVGALGSIDALVYAAGVVPLRLIADADAHHWHDTLATNLVGAALITRAALPHLTPGSVCVYLSSDVVDRPRDGMAAYGASKAGLDALVAGLRLEHADRRFVRVAIGPTGRTHAGRDMDHELATTLFPRWEERGLVGPRDLDAVDLGALLAESLAVWLDHPDVGVEDLAVEPVEPDSGR